MKRVRFCQFIFLFGSLAAFPQAETVCPYSAEFFSFQNRHFNIPAQSHTWGQYTEIDSFGRRRDIDISFMAALEYFKHFFGHDRLPMHEVVPGALYSSEGTRQFALASGLVVIPEGRFCITRELFLEAEKQFRLLSTGRVQYRALDHKTRNPFDLPGPGQAIDCITAHHQIIVPWLPRTPDGRIQGIGSRRLRHRFRHGTRATQWLIDVFASSGQLFIR